MHQFSSHNAQLLQKIASKAAFYYAQVMFCDCSLQTPFGGAEQHGFQAQGMLMDAHCSCSRSACETRALPEFSKSGCQEDTICWFGGTLAATLAQSTAAAWPTCSCIHQQAPDTLQHTCLPLWAQPKEIASKAMAAWPGHWST